MGSFITVIGLKETKQLIHNITNRLPKAIVDGVCQKTAQRAARSARGILSRAENRKRRGGLLAQGIRVFKLDVNSYIMVASAFDDYGFDYARAVALGAVPHMIGENPDRPAFGIPGLIIAHPGISGRTNTFNFHTKARDSAFMVVDRIIEGEFRTVFQK